MPSRRYLEVFGIVVVGRPYPIGGCANTCLRESEDPSRVRPSFYRGCFPSRGPFVRV